MSEFTVGDIVFCRKYDHVGYYIISDIMYQKLCKIKCARLDSLVYLDYPWHECFHEFDRYCEKQSVKRIQCGERNFRLLKQMHGIGNFYHDLSPLYEKLCTKPPKFIIFRSIQTNRQIILHLGKATKVLKRIGFEHNGDYKQVRVVKPMVKLQFIGEL